MSQGYIKLPRNDRDGPLWNDKRPKTRYEAWLDIRMEIRHSPEPQKVLIGNRTLLCSQGESLKSVGTWAARWGWDESKVRRFFKLLEYNLGYIETKGEGKTTRLKVINHETYGGKRRDCDEVSDETDDSGKDENRRSQAVENKEVTSDSDEEMTSTRREDDEQNDDRLETKNVKNVKNAIASTSFNSLSDKDSKELVDEHIKRCPVAQEHHRKQLGSKCQKLYQEMVQKGAECPVSMLWRAVEELSAKGKEGDGWGVIIAGIRKGWVESKMREGAYQQNLERDQAKYPKQRRVKNEQEQIMDEIYGRGEYQEK